MTRDFVEDNADLDITVVDVARAADPHDGTTITAVAARWEFADLSRFTARYRSTYGQPPSHTLRG